MNIQEISEALGGKQNSNGYMCHCPAHDDKNPSLSLSEKNGKIPVKCFARCQQNSVISALAKRGLQRAVSNSTENKSNTHIDLALRGEADGI